MAYMAVYTVGYQRVLLSDLQYCRPVSTEVCVRSPQEQKCHCENSRAYPAKPSGELIIGKVQPRRKQIEQRCSHRQTGNDKKDDVHYVPVLSDGFAMSASKCIYLSNHGTCNKTHKKNSSKDIIDSQQVSSFAKRYRLVRFSYSGLILSSVEFWSTK
jgi:hypothetical protein